jgi:hypothetical protein
MLVPRSLIKNCLANSDGPVAFNSKCVIRDAKELFVSSANFNQAARNRNIEMGFCRPRQSW